MIHIEHKVYGIVSFENLSDIMILHLQMHFVITFAQFVHARTTNKHDVTLPVPHISVTSQIEM